LRHVVELARYLLQSEHIQTSCDSDTYPINIIPRVVQHEHIKGRMASLMSPSRVLGTCSTETFRATCRITILHPHSHGSAAMYASKSLSCPETEPKVVSLNIVLIEVGNSRLAEPIGLVWIGLHLLDEKLFDVVIIFNNCLHLIKLQYGRLCHIFQ
jgi:hypothetical protein